VGFALQERISKQFVRDTSFFSTLCCSAVAQQVTGSNMDRSYFYIRFYKMLLILLLYFSGCYEFFCLGTAVGRHSRLIFGTSMYLEPPYIRKSLYLEPPYIPKSLYLEEPYIQNGLVFGTALYHKVLVFGRTLYSKRSCIWNRLTFGTSMYLEPPYIRNVHVFGTALYSERPCIWNRLTFGTSMYLEPPYFRNVRVFGTALHSKRLCTWNGLVFGIALYSELPYVRTSTIYRSWKVHSFAQFTKFIEIIRNRFLTPQSPPFLIYDHLHIIHY
jgi:hypothetical protein